MLGLPADPPAPPEGRLGSAGAAGPTPSPAFTLLAAGRGDSPPPRACPPNPPPPAGRGMHLLGLPSPLTPLPGGARTARRGVCLPANRF